jgi:hypothetical protein
VGLLRRKAAEAFDRRILQPIAGDLEPGEVPLFRSRATVFSIDSGAPRGLVDAYITNRYFHYVDAKFGSSTARHRLDKLQFIRSDGSEVDAGFEVDSETLFIAPMKIIPADAARTWVVMLMKAYADCTGEAFPLDRVLRGPRPS